MRRRDALDVEPIRIVGTETDSRNGITSQFPDFAKHPSLANGPFVLQHYNVYVLRHQKMKTQPAIGAIQEDTPCKEIPKSSTPSTPD